MKKYHSSNQKNNNYSITISTKIYTYYILIFSFFYLFTSCNNQKNNPKTLSNSKNIDSSKPLFTEVSSKTSNIQFNNSIKENINTLENLFNFDYFYNGSGVGVEDINNDGLLDIFFCGNQVPNKLYLNKGNLVFEDISNKANINIGKKWSNGVTFVDINNDGFIDIYVSQGGPNNRSNRDNLLYINNKDLTFTESGQAYGLADKGISTQSAFFDYDKDGDLDCIVVNENELYGIDPINLKRLVKENTETAYFNSSHFYENIEGHFKDKTKEAGLSRPIFGLGLSVGDINNDNWLDIYVTSDYYLPDALFINNGNGTFKDSIKSYTKQISYYGMGVDIADINNDNLQDIYTLDMASSDHFRAKTLMASMSSNRFSHLVNKEKFQYQYMFNSFQLNIGNNKFNNIAQLTETANTDWSWSVLLSDFDNDTNKDIYITNGFRRYALDNDLQRQVFETKKKYKNNVPSKIKQQLYNQMPSEKLSNILYQNNGNLDFKNVANKWGLSKPSFSNGAASGDFDNDGDLDLVVNNLDQEAFLYKNNTIEQNLGNYLNVKTVGENSESFAKVKIYTNGKTQFIETKRVRGYMSSQENTAHFGLANETKIDSIIIQWPSGFIEKKHNIKANNNIVFYEKNAKTKALNKNSPKPYFTQVSSEKLGINYSHQENYYDDFEDEILLPYKQSQLGPFISTGDINGDNKEDVFIGGASGQSGQIYIQTKTGYKNLNSQALNTDSGYEDMESVFFDFDLDGDLDLYVVSGGNSFEPKSSYYTDRLYINDGKGKLSKWQNSVLNQQPKSGKSVSLIDFDSDGDNDLIIGNRIIAKNYPIHSSSILYENTGGNLIDVTSKKAPDLINFGIINSITTTDFNADGKQDFIAVGEWTSIGFFENNNGTFERKQNTPSTIASKGWWFCVKETDINNDGLPDYIIGNLGLNSKYKASNKKPFKIYANDFDENGTNDIVLSKLYNGEYVPFRGKECSSQQMPFINNKFPKYSDFAKATLSDIYGEKLKTSYNKDVTNFASVLLLNNGDGIFTQKLLPIEAQSFPILDITFHDFNGDGFQDCLIGGNIYNTEVETPRLDAISGIVMLSNKIDGYIITNNEKSGLYPDSNVKNLKLLNHDKGKTLLITSNNNESQVYRLTDN